MKIENNQNHSNLKLEFEKALQNEFLYEEGNFEGYDEFNGIQEEYVELILAMITGDINPNSKDIREMLSNYMLDTLELKDLEKIRNEVNREYE